VVDVVGPTGLDSARDNLIERLHALGAVETSGMIAVAGRPTTRKLRVLGARQQIVRIDEEDTSPFDSLVEERLLAACRT
jgi:D-beta-D-heptose 7-phosphate kinase/D-beta-D-heptose 1-phosphate adenosyltransferase